MNAVVCQNHASCSHRLYQLLWWALVHCPDTLTPVTGPELPHVKSELSSQGWFNFNPETVLSNGRASLFRTAAGGAPLLAPKFRQEAAKHGTALFTHGSRLENWLSILRWAAPLRHIQAARGMQCSSIAPHTACPRRQTRVSAALTQSAASAPRQAH